MKLKTLSLNLFYGRSSSSSSINCGQICLNKAICTECIDGTCPCKTYCQNRRFQNQEYSAVYPKPAGGKGWGLFAGENFKKGQFILQYIGEVYDITSDVGKERLKRYKVNFL